MSDPKQKEAKPPEPAPEKLKCGIIMPISDMGDYTKAHWAEVLTIIGEALEETQYKAEMVSNDNLNPVIQGKIVGNLYANPIVVCDVSGSNPNVLFELGMRLAFDKPTIIIKDDVTKYIFDTSPLKHIAYPRSLHYHQILGFKQELKNEVMTATKAGYKSYLSHFAQYKLKASKLESEELPAAELILKELASIKDEIANQKKTALRIDEMSVEPTAGVKAVLTGNLENQQKLFSWLHRKGVSHFVIHDDSDTITLSLPASARIVPAEFIKSASELGINVKLEMTRIKRV
jgi:hypothetical protein